jgi:hypothetical protein
MVHPALSLPLTSPNNMVHPALSLPHTSPNWRYDYREIWSEAPGIFVTAPGKTRDFVDMRVWIFFVGMRSFSPLPGACNESLITYLKVPFDISVIVNIDCRQRLYPSGNFCNFTCTGVWSSSNSSWFYLEENGRFFLHVKEVTAVCSFHFSVPKPLQNVLELVLLRVP